MGGTVLSGPCIPVTTQTGTDSSSTPFSLAANPSPIHPDRRNTAPDVLIIANESYVEPTAITQLNAVSKLQGVLSTIGMPDLHPGTTFPVGATVITHGSTIRPALIGGDIGCGMALYVTGVSAQKAKAKPSWIANKIRDIEGAWGGELDCTVTDWLHDAGVKSVDSTWNSSLGTIGGGNHFAELQVIEKIWDQTAFDEYVTSVSASSGVHGRPQCSDDEGVEHLTDIEAIDPTSHLFLLVHSGSRGLGQNILASTKSSLSSAGVHTGAPLVKGTEEFETYLTQHDDACKWARCNRDLIAHRILECIDETYFPHPSSHSSEGELHSSPVPSMLKRRKVLDIWHNNVEQNHEWKPSSGSETSTNPNSVDIPTCDSVWVHRKGAAPSDRGLVVIPGSRGAYSFLALPTGPQRRNGESL